MAWYCDAVLGPHSLICMVGRCGEVPSQGRGWGEVGLREGRRRPLGPSTPESLLGCKWDSSFPGSCTAISASCRQRALQSAQEEGLSTLHCLLEAHTTQEVPGRSPGSWGLCGHLQCEPGQCWVQTLSPGPDAAAAHRPPATRIPAGEGGRTCPLTLPSLTTDFSVTRPPPRAHPRPGEGSGLRPASAAVMGGRAPGGQRWP